MTETARVLTGVQKAALVLMQMNQENASAILRQFTEVEAEEIAGEIVRLRRVDPESVEKAVTEFHEKTMSGAMGARGGREFAEELLQATFGVERAAGVLDRLATSMAGPSFDFLESADPGQVSSLLSGELPETIALVLAHLNPHTASDIIARFDSETRVAVAQAIAGLGSATPEAVAIVAESLKHRARAMVVPREQLEVVGGVQPLVDIINRADIATEHELLEALDARDPVLADEVRARLVTFADILKLEKKDVQQVLRGIDSKILATAMKGAAKDVTDVIRDNMTERNRETLDEEIGLLGPVRKKQVDEARADVVRSMRELEAQGLITLQRADEPEEEYVA
ncbi:flagellar motor switch protein FliG [Galbitalea soli]|uniref:Flagellar motor switch protein FliG n=1 Tax=Galbitalea soli TaxID=1268042 RepID=A0A7C9PMS2_9MICO|nr:flagellar motor switch protein FliG [Galbitalea soli]NEM91174.1 flagellar motor switch protein FliG [Galbitalea soli]NYJ29863.1 flagellar motor switch protein FliG [Galbitalea soli]